jgi:hypothetical protein
MMKHKIRTAARAISEGQASDLLEVVRERWHLDVESYGLRRDLSIPFPAPPARPKVEVRELRLDEIHRLLDLDLPNIKESDRKERLSRLQLVEAGIGTCYGAVTADGTPCFAQWLFAPNENEAVQRFFKGLFPMGPGEALLEGAFTLERYRGLGMMSHATALIAERAADVGARSVVTFVPKSNTSSLKGCQRAGFVPFLWRTERWRYFRRNLSFKPLPEGTPYPFERSGASSV